MTPNYSDSKSKTAAPENVIISQLFPDHRLPLLIKPARPDLNLTRWAEANRSFIEKNLLDCGGILFRGFGLREPAELEAFIQACSDTLLEYRERSSPRNQVSGRIYTSTEHPPNQHIFLHNENSYQDTWPMKIFFMCVIQPEQGGETPIADCRKILNRVAPATRENFERKGFRIVRNFSGFMGLPWQTVFQTEDREVVNAYCREHGITPEWRPDGNLRTLTSRPAVAHHPQTGVKTWFNHGTFFHVTTLDPELSEVLLASLPEEDLPTNSYYGDGQPIEAETLEELRQAYRDETVMFPWQRGDVLVLDNMLTAHGRSPFKGNRKIVVGMSEPMTRDNLAKLEESFG